jgi:hypothetical protein
MRKLFARLIAVLFVSCGFAFGQEITLDLSKPTLDSTVWKTYSPNTQGASSHQYVQGNRLELTNGEWLYLADPPNSETTSVEGSFTLRDEWDTMYVILNSAGDPTIPTNYPQHPADGVIVEMGGVDNSGGVDIRLLPNRKQLSVAPTAFTFNVGETYRFLIVDDGENLSVKINGNEVTSADYRSEQGFIDGGSNVILQNREGWPSAHTAYIHSYKISSPTQFQIVEGNFTWDEAKADAETRGGRLAIIDTPEKNSTVMALGGNWNKAHIGLTDREIEGEWKWINGTPLTWNDWKGGEPNDAGGEDVAIIVKNQGWNDEWVERDGQFLRFPYVLEILNETPPSVPFIALDPLYESPSGEALTIDATPTIGFPTEFTYQWCFNGFKIPANLGGTASSINIDNLTANEGTWSVTVTNSEGIFEQDFEYRLYADSDSDGLSDAYEELISETDINKPDTDNDGLSDAEEFNVYRTNPNSPDTDSDGFTDLYELETAYDPNSAESVPDALVNIMTAIEVKFNAALGATYAIEFSTDSQNWSVIEDDIVGEGGAVERLYSKTDFPTGFFRVERRDQ